MKQRIAVVTTSYPSRFDDVSGHFVRSEVAELAARGHELTVLCPGRPGSEPPALDHVVVRHLGAERLFGWPGALVKLRQNPLSALALPCFVWRCRRELQTGGFDRVIAHWLLGSGWPIGIATDAPLEVVVHGSDARLLGRLGPLREVILDALEARGCQLRLVAPHLGTLLRTPTNAAWLAAAKVAPLPIAVPVLPEQSELRAALGVPLDCFLVVCVGRVIASKRLAVALSKTPLPANAKVVVVGSGPLLESLREQFPLVHFTGQVSRQRALAWLKAADVALSASRDEGAPTALREARLLGTEVWTAEFGDAARWSEQDPGVRVLGELA